MRNVIITVILCALFAFGCASTPQKKYAKVGTAELKLRHSQLTQALEGEKGQPDIEWIKPLWFRGPSRSDRIKEKEEIEFELLRRYKSGDKEAKLPIFAQ